MREPNCERFREQIAVEPQRPSDELLRHIRGCDGCGDELALLQDALGILRQTAEVAPRPELDRAVRDALGLSPKPQTALRPFLALGLATAGLLAFVAAIAVAFAQAGAAERGPILAALAVWAYLALCCTASLPVLLARRVSAAGSEMQ